MNERAFEVALDEWIDNFRAEARRQFAAGCLPQDVLKIAMNVADSKQNRRAVERQALAIPDGAARRM